MKLYSLDTIVRNTLLQEGLPLHYYIEFMTHAANCLSELTMDDLKSVNTVILTLDDAYSANLPDDYVDYTKVGIQVGQLVRPLVPQDSINRLVNRDTAGVAETYTQTVGVTGEVVVGYISSLYWNTVNFNEYGENTGREYGVGAGFQTDTFKIIPERCQIQVSEFSGCSEIIMEYISDGSCASSATGVTPYAKSTIDAYIKWKRSKNRNTILSPEGQEYARQRKILRARKNDLSIDLMRRILQDAFYASPKS